jgi:hypothetical protein
MTALSSQIMTRATCFGGAVVAGAGVTKEGLFFFEKKKQKTFVLFSESRVQARWCGAGRGSVLRF